MSWVYDPHTGGLKIPPSLYNSLRKEVAVFSYAQSWHGKIELKLRFKNQSFYIDVVDQADESVFPLCRLRYLNSEKWSLTIFTYSNERYSISYFKTGKWEGTITEALETCENFINPS